MSGFFIVYRCLTKAMPHCLSFSSLLFWNGFRLQKPLSIPGYLALRPEPHLQSQPVRNHRDEFRICRLALDARHRVAEIALQRLDIF